MAERVKVWTKGNRADKRVAEQHFQRRLIIVSNAFATVSLKPLKPVIMKDGHSDDPVKLSSGEVLNVKALSVI